MISSLWMTPDCFLLPEHLICSPAALFPTREILFSFRNLHLNMFQIKALPSFYAEIQEQCYYLPWTISLQILSHPNTLLLLPFAVYQPPDSPSHQSFLLFTNPYPHLSAYYQQPAQPSPSFTCTIFSSSAFDLP